MALIIPLVSSSLVCHHLRFEMSDRLPLRKEKNKKVTVLPIKHSDTDINQYKLLLIREATHLKPPK